ncbi:MAG: hypothetical protein FD167_1208 [bacterium]|nr:MAG: hypothetical protein FD167_1208 [bacterium]
MQNSAVLRKTGQSGQAIVLLKEAISMMNKLVTNDPSNRQYPFLLADAYVERGKAEWVNRNIKQAISFYNKAEQIFQELLNNDPNNIRVQRYLAEIHQLLAIGYIKTGNKNNAKKYLATSFNLYKSLIIKNPINMDFQLGFISTLNQFTTFLVKEREENKATKILEEALEHYEIAVTKEPSAIELSNYAWLLLNCEPKRLRNQTLAIKYAEQANEISKGKNLLILLNLSIITKNSVGLGQIQNSIKQLLDYSS